MTSMIERRYSVRRVGLRWGVLRRDGDGRWCEVSPVLRFWSHAFAEVVCATIAREAIRVGEDERIAADLKAGIIGPNRARLDRARFDDCTADLGTPTRRW